MNDTATTISSAVTTEAPFTLPHTQETPLVPSPVATSESTSTTPAPQPLRIKKISINGYRAFPQYRPHNFEVSLGDDGKNLLLYGENGSGKTSLFKALRDLFNRDLKDTAYTSYQNIFDIGTDDGITAELTSGSPPSFSWGVGTVHPSIDKDKTAFNAFTRSCFFLDYRSLLETNFVHKNNANPNLYTLLVGTILKDVMPPGSRTIRESREILSSALDAVRSYGNSLNQRNAVAAAEKMTTALSTLIPNVVVEANIILGKLQPGTIINLTTPTITYSNGTQKKDRKYTGESIELLIELNGKPIPTPQHFLNEARLSAIALSIYLAGAKFSRAGRPGILVLDDVLIGLDLSNRIPLLELLQNDFANWQIFLFTHDHVWYDLARTWVGEKWISKELFLVSKDTMAFDRPELRDGDLLAKAKGHLDNKDLTAAAVYIRARFETILSRVCQDSGIEIKYKKNPKNISADNLWQGIQSRQRTRVQEGQSDFITPQLMQDVEQVRSNILNKLCHSASPSFTDTEVQYAFDIITELSRFDFNKR